VRSPGIEHRGVRYDTALTLVKESTADLTPI
jgi:hypothetical protein